MNKTTKPKPAPILIYSGTKHRPPAPASGNLISMATLVMLGIILGILIFGK